MLRAALNHAFASRKLLVPIPLSLPDKSVSRECWLKRKEAARLLLGARGFRMVECSDLKTRETRWFVWDRRPERINHHCTRFIMIGLYTGARHDAILGLGWKIHTQGGWIDLERRVLYRRTPGTAETKKKQTRAPLPEGLQVHLRRWKKADGMRLLVVTWDGDRMA
jgi:hypothetical protein